VQQSHGVGGVQQSHTDTSVSVLHSCHAASLLAAYARYMQWRDMPEHTDGPGSTLQTLLQLMIRSALHLWACAPRMCDVYACITYCLSSLIRSYIHTQMLFSRRSFISGALPATTTSSTESKKRLILRIPLERIQNKDPCQTLELNHLKSDYAGLGYII